jgi:hypothetical protein
MGQQWKIQSKNRSKRAESGFRGDAEDIQAIGASVGEEDERFREEYEACITLIGRFEILHLGKHQREKKATGTRTTFRTPVFHS